MFVYPPITRLQTTSENTAERMNDVFKDVFFPVLKIAKQHTASWKRNQRTEFRKLAFALHDAEKSNAQQK
jgi:hypothetical protein